ncbi:MAG: DUF1292 domain-containing protein [Vampirovibrionales bacterium]
MTSSTPQDALLEELKNALGEDFDPTMVDSVMIEATDEDGNVHLFEKLDEYELEGQRYALLVYAGQKEGSLLGGHQHSEACNHGDDDEEEAVVMRIDVDDDGVEVFEEIKDEAEYERVVAYVEQQLSEEYEEDE